MKEWLGEAGENKLSDWDISRDAPYFGFEIPGAPVSGLTFFNRQHLYLVGAFDEDLQLFGNEINQFSLRCMGLGLYNYYIPSQTCVFLSEGKYINPTDFGKGSENMMFSISAMRKIRNFYIPL